MEQFLYEWNIRFKWVIFIFLGFLLSSFFYGFIVTGIPGGWLSGKIGGTIVYGGGILGTAVATIVMPGAARISPYLVAVLSVIQGLFAVSCFQNLQTVYMLNVLIKVVFIFS